MRKVLLRILAGIGAMTLLGMVMAVVAASWWGARRTSLPETMVLEWDVQHPPAEAEADGVAALLERSLSLRRVVETLDRAGQDPRVKGLVVRLGSEGFGVAQTQELRAAIARFRASGRFAWVFADSFGEMSGGTRSYYLASAFERIWLQPVGQVGMTGLAVEVPFARTALETLHVTPLVQRRHDYKTMANSLTEDGFTPAHREMLTSLLGDLRDQVATEIAPARGLAPERVRSLMDQAPLLDREALDAKLVDTLGYYDELKAAAQERGGGNAAFRSLGRYRTATQATLKAGAGPIIAFVHATGTILRGKSQSLPQGLPLGSGGTLGSASFEAAMDAAIADAQVRAIVVRVDSGGGSAVASETMRRAVVRAKAAGKPVVVSMGDTAASGGYWLAMNADRIFASPGTLTGSIGVLGGKLVTEGFWQQLGVHWEAVEEGAHAGIWSTRKTYSPSEQARIEAVLDSIYDTFVRNVAAARNLSEDQVRAVAQGRVWTGRQALAHGLIDVLGDLPAAVAEARTRAGLVVDKDAGDNKDQAAASRILAPLVPFPRDRSPFGRLQEWMSGGAGTDMAAGTVTEGVAALWEGLFLQVRHLGLLVFSGQRAILRMPPWELVNDGG